MKQLGKILLVTLGFGISAAVLGFVTSGQVGAQDPGPPGGLNVKVVNTPLPVSGNINATISGTPTVKAQQSGTWNVGINGSVPVINPGGASPTPLIVSDANNPALTPFQARLCVTGSGNPCMAPFNFPSSITVPAGKRLVIEQFAGECFPGAGTLAIGLTVTTNSTTVSHLFGLSYPLGTSTTGYANHLTRLYADGGTTITTANNALVPANLGCDVAISGHLFPQ